MYKIIVKKIKLIILLTIFTIIHLADATSPTKHLQYPFYYYLAGAATSFIIGKIIYSYYQTYNMTHEQIIENWRLTYKSIYKDVQNYHNFYQSDVQISDWDLKEAIIYNTQEKYPFMTYYSSLIKASWHLNKHLVALNNQLIEINNHQKKMSQNYSENNIHLQEVLLQLEKKGKYLQEYTLKTLTLLMILKNKIKLFKEYNDDYHNWSQSDRCIKTIPIDKPFPG
ncbi:MAG TPA: hypothetical protein VLB80_02495 [Candidatus Babeliales bacterium]|nr:hypothetical protein [Candidatus Babeliales bacterium]